MSLESQSKAANALDFAEVGTKITVYYVHQHQGIQVVTGVITSMKPNKLVVEPDKPHDSPILHVAKCQEYWDEEITVCSRDWIRLGAVLLMTSNRRPIYCAYPNGI